MLDRLHAADKAAIAEEVKGWADALMAKSDVMLRQRGIIQLACAAVHALTGESSANQAALTGDPSANRVALTGESSANWAAVESQEQQLLQHALDGMMHTCTVSLVMCLLMRLLLSMLSDSARFVAGSRKRQQKQRHAPHWELYNKQLVRTL